MFDGKAGTTQTVRCRFELNLWMDVTGNAIG
jgi:hypothetical protein